MLDLPDELLSTQARVAGALGDVERVFAEQLRSDLPPVDEMCAHLESYRGKMLRPTLVLLCGLAAGGDLSERHTVCAAVCEMVHMATLVHDDVLDEAEIRRRGRTVNAVRGNETSVILGDYLIASAYELCSSLDSPVPSRIVGNASAVMCTGELLQLHNRDNLSLDEGTYFEILRRKTAALIGAACNLGALCSIGFDQSGSGTASALREYGTLLGVAFQIQDDVLDLTGTLERVGKSVGKDLEKGKLTYPMIHHLSNAGPEDRARSLELARGLAEADDGGERVSELLGLIEGTGSLAATQEKALEYVGGAKRALGTLPGTPARDMLMLMADRVVDRTH